MCWYRDIDMLNAMSLYGPLDNYIFSNRLRTGLSQDDVAALIALSDRTAVGRYEQGLRLPNLRAGIALEIIFDEPIQAIFAGTAYHLRPDLVKRAQGLLESTSDEPLNALKLETLARLIRLDEEDFGA